MKKKFVLAVDMGGTSIKVGLFKEGRIKKEHSWEHNYKNEEIEKAKVDLVEKLKYFCNDDIYSIGLSLAGLIGSDESLFRSTVLTSFEGFNLVEYLKEKMGVERVTIDNDADCGALGEWSAQKGEFLYVVLGSGIGSAFINNNGKLPYRVRVDPGQEFNDSDNPIPNDLGLQVSIPKSVIYERFNSRMHDKIDEILFDNEGNTIKGANNDIVLVRAGSLGSALGLDNILNIMMQPDDVRTFYDTKLKKTGIDYKSDKRRTGIILGQLALNGESIAKEIFEHMGYFLGYGVAEATKVVMHDQGINGKLEVRFAGPIMNSHMFFLDEAVNTINKRGVDCKPGLAKHLTKSNLYGAYLRTSGGLDE